MSDTVRIAGINMDLLGSTEMFFKTFSGMIEAVKSGMVDYGILPNRR